MFTWEKLILCILSLNDGDVWGGGIKQNRMNDRCAHRVWVSVFIRTGYWRTVVITEQWMSVWARDMKIAHYALATSYEWQVCTCDFNPLSNKKGKHNTLYIILDHPVCMSLCLSEGCSLIARKLIDWFKIQVWLRIWHNTIECRNVPKVWSGKLKTSLKKRFSATELKNKVRVFEILCAKVW